MSDFEQTDLSTLLSALDRYSSLKIWVVGDLMLDEYVMGAVDRVSPEAPVPVVRVRETEHRLGGAANVARQVAALGAKVSLAGTIGTDAAGTTSMPCSLRVTIIEDRPAAVINGRAAAATDSVSAGSSDLPEAVSSSRRFGVMVVAPR